MFSSAASYAVVGANHPSQRGKSRAAEIACCAPGDVLTLRREPRKVGGCRVVGVYSADGIQLGYVSSDQSDEIAGQVAVARAIFQRADTFGAVIRMTLDGTTPTLPVRREPKRFPASPVPPPDEYCGIFPNHRPIISDRHLGAS